jgi:hypothetical protein
MFVYAKIGKHGAGLTNQIFSLICTIINAHKNNYKVIVVDSFLNDISKDTYTPISEIFNIDEINLFLKKNYYIIIIDKYNIHFDILSIVYGADEYTVDLTNHYMDEYLTQNKLFIPKNTCFNTIHSDPCLGIMKQFFFKYSINGTVIQEIFPENLERDICIDFNGDYVFTYGWIHSHGRDAFEHILTHIQYNNDFIIQKNKLIRHFNLDSKINIIHLRLEDDAISHWSRQNNMSKSEFKLCIEDKYIHLFKTHISQDDTNIILSYSSSNRVIDFLIDNHYNYTFIDKIFHDREKDGIIDLLVSKCCNHVFISNFNIHNLNGSTFSYYIGKLLNPSVLTIYIDLDHIHNDEVLV